MDKEYKGKNKKSKVKKVMQPQKLPLIKNLANLYLWLKICGFHKKCRRKNNAISFKTKKEGKKKKGK